MDDEIDLRDIFHILWKRRLLIIAVFAIAVLVAGVISFTMPPVYRISSIVALGNFEDPVYTSQASAKIIILSDEFLLGVFEELSSNARARGFGSFKESVKVEPLKDSDMLIEISVETPGRQQGREAVEKIVGLYAKNSEDSYNKYKKIMSDQLAVTQERLDAIDTDINLTRKVLMDLQESSSSPEAVQVEIRFSRTLDRLSDMEAQRSVLIDRSLDQQKQLAMIKHLDIVQPAREPVSPIWPKKTLIVAVAGMLGLMVGIFAAFLLELFGRKVE
jgi:capsular polysaccharide biosynthesis protein